MVQNLSKGKADFFPNLLVREDVRNANGLAYAGASLGFSGFGNKGNPTILPVVRNLIDIRSG
jgi:hypothetical protein